MPEINDSAAHRGPVALANADLVASEAAVQSYALAEKAQATRRAYKADFAIFADWCQLRHGVEALSASAEIVTAFLAGQASVGVRPSTLTRRLASIGYAHKLAGLPSPAAHQAVRAVIRGIRRTEGAAVKQKAPATAERVGAMVAAIPIDTVQGKRDRALLLIGFAGDAPPGLTYRSCYGRLVRLTAIIAHPDMKKAAPYKSGAGVPAGKRTTRTRCECLSLAMVATRKVTIA